ncbi:hypothetical protein FGO68_gene13945 [Halteria grandinella]|uniref:Uncharacterized protein n=1 Tax=Halteria grandinella TaxID=5974 RepID=A0A8J8NH72_HALGN|nr:hypothetical protein FGO68_gene13945 [Halteria grandinella]
MSICELRQQLLENTINQALPCIRTVCTSDKFCSYLPFSCLNWSRIITFSKKTKNIYLPFKHRACSILQRKHQKTSNINDALPQLTIGLTGLISAH